MNIRSIEGENFEGKKVLVRVDFNVELDQNQHVTEQYKLESPKKTIDTLLAFPGVKVALLSHLGRPKGEKVKALSLELIANDVSRAIGHPIRFIGSCVGESVRAGLETQNEGEVLLLENVRFHSEEERNDLDFAKQLAEPFDVYINEAFSVCHRDQASVTGVTKYLPSYGGIRLLHEIDRLSDVRDDPIRPAIAVIGGAKIETKLPLIRKFETIFDAVLVGGKIANEAIDQKISFSDRVLLPRDFQGEDARLDIGPMTAGMYSEIIKKGRTIVWNGPMGKFEEKPYDAGTNAILTAMLESKGDVIIGGGESLAVVEIANIMHKIGFVSTGGGAMLEFMSGAKLPGLIALEEASANIVSGETDKNMERQLE